MNTLPSFVKQFKRITPKTISTLLPFYSTRLDLLPHYFMSPVLLFSYCFYYAVIDNCLLLLKREWISGYPIIYLLVPPMSMTGDITAEQYLLKHCLSLGISSRIYDDISWMKSAESADLVGEEYIYRSADML